MFSKLKKIFNEVSSSLFETNPQNYSDALSEVTSESLKHGYSSVLAPNFFANDFLNFLDISVNTKKHQMSGGF